MVAFALGAVSFQDSFHEVVPGYRINGKVLVFAIRSIKEGGIGEGAKVLELGSFGLANKTLIELPEGSNVPDGMTRVDSVDAVYEALELAGLSTVVTGVLVNPPTVALLEYGEDFLIADAVGEGGRFTFTRDPQGGQWTRDGNNFTVPTTQFDLFKEQVLARLSTIVEIIAEAASSYIALDGSNDYIEFSGKGAANVGLLDWTASWSVGVNLVGFDVKADGQYLTIFRSGSNAILLRRGGSNYGMYVTGNNGATKIGANTWYAPEDGGKLLFTYDSTTQRLKYYIGKADGSYNLRANYLVNTANIGGNTVGTEFCIGKPVSNSLYYHGGFNNLIVAAEALGGPLVDEYFQVNNTYDQASFYGDLTSWAKLGEDPFPTVVDTLGALTGGELKNGQENDFVELDPPTPAPDPSQPVVGTTVAYTPNYVFTSGSYNNSYESYSGGDAVYDTFGIEKIEVSDSFMTIHFNGAGTMGEWRGTGRSVDLEPAATQDWEGTAILATSTEYSVSTAFNYVHYSLPQMLGSTAKASAMAAYLAQGGAGSSVCDFIFEGQAEGGTFAQIKKN